MIRSPPGEKKASSLTDLTKPDATMPLKRKNTHDYSELLDLIIKMKEDQDQKFNAIAKGIEELRSQNQTILNTQENMEKFCASSLKQHADTKAAIDKLSVEHNEALVKINTLEEQLEEVQRTQRSKCMEIINVPEADSENLFEVVKKLHYTLKIDHKPESINNVHRNKNSKGKPIIVEYQSQSVRNTVLKASKSFNKANKTERLHTHALGFIDKLEPIYINELLTPKTRQLYFHARTQIKNRTLTFCWINNGRLFVKQSEHSPAIQIKSMSQLEVFQQTMQTTA